MQLYAKTPGAGVEYSNVGHPWLPGIFKRMPWVGFGLLLGSLFGLIAAALVLVYSNGDPISEWKYQPTVYLSAAYTITNVLLAAALAQGATISWWRKAIGPKTTLEDLHNYWAFGGNIKETLLAGRKTNLIAIAALLVAITPANGPLLQRASTVRLHNTTLTGETVQIPALKNFSFADGSGYLTGRQSNPGYLAPKFEPVARAFLDGLDIELPDSGCPTNGICTGHLDAAGFAISCENSTEAFNNTENIGRGGASSGFPNNEVFKTSFGWQRDAPYHLNFTTKVKNTAECQGVILVKECSLRLATMRYPVFIDGSRNTIALKPGTSIFDDKGVAEADELPIESTGLSMLSGIYLTLTGQYASSLSMMNSGTRGYSLEPSNDALLAQFTDFQALDQYGGLTDALAGFNACHLRFNDPFDYIMNKTRDLMFRKALADANSTATQAVTVDVQSSTNVYHTNYTFVAIAVFITLLSTIFVATTFYGYWELGREVSMSPLEIAKAFDAPLLAMEDSNNNSKALVKSIGNKSVRYGVIIEPVEHTPMYGFKGSGAISQGGVRSAILGIAERDTVRAPRNGQHYKP